MMKTAKCLQQHHRFLLPGCPHVQEAHHTVEGAVPALLQEIQNVILCLPAYWDSRLSGKGMGALMDCLTTSGRFFIIASGE
jgi:hypothetical protein